MMRPRVGPKWCNRGSKMAPLGSKMVLIWIPGGSGDLIGSRCCAKMASRAPQGPKRSPNGAQKGAQKGAKRHQKSIKIWTKNMIEFRLQFWTNLSPKMAPKLIKKWCKFDQHLKHKIVILFSHNVNLHRIASNKWFSKHWKMLITPASTPNIKGCFRLRVSILVSIWSRHARFNVRWLCGSF